MKKRIITGLLIAAIIVSGVILSVNAADGTITLKSSKTSAKQGDTFTVTLSAASADGINGLTGEVEYDQTKLELIEINVANSNWYNAGQDLEIAVIGNSTDTIISSDIINVKFKVKGSAEIGSNAKISFKELVLDTDADQDSECNIGTKEITVSIVSSNSGGDTNTNTNTNTNNNNSNTNTNTNTNNSTNNTSTNSSTNTNSVKVTGNTQSTAKTMPYTGTSMIIIGTVCFVGMIAIVAYVSYKRYKNI